MESKKDPTLSKYVKIPPKLKAYRLEENYRKPSLVNTVKTRPQTQISAFSQTFSNGLFPLEIQRDTSEIMQNPKKTLKMRIKHIVTTRLGSALKLNNFSSKLPLNLKTEFSFNIVNRKNKTKIKNFESQILNEGKPFDIDLTTNKIFKENLITNPNSINKINTYSSIDVPNDNLSGALMDSLFRKNDINTVRKSILLNLRNSPERTSVNSLTNSSKRRDENYKIPLLPEETDRNQQMEVYLNMKNYKMSKNIVNSLKKVCENTIKERSKPSDQSFLEEKLLEIYSTLLIHLSKIPSIIVECLNNRENKEMLFSSIFSMTEELMKTNDHSLYVEGLKLQGKIYKIYGDLSKCLQTYTQAMQLCNKHDLYKLKMKIYKRLGNLYLGMQNLPKAKSNFIKALRMAWFISSKKYELFAYDLLGLIAYYEGANEKAYYYHNRMLKCELEDKNSSTRLVAINKIKSKIEVRKTMENNYTSSDTIISSDEEEVGLYEVKKKLDSYDFFSSIGKTVKKRQKWISFGEKQKMLIRQTGSSMFRNKTNIKEEFLPENVIKKIRNRLQKEREINNLLETSKKINIHDVLSQLPEEISSEFRSDITNATFDPKNDCSQSEKKYPIDLIKGIYGIQKSIVLKNSQKIENFKFMKITSLNKKSFLLSHLSSNRNLDRFSKGFDANQYNKKNVTNELKLYLDKKTSQKIKKSLMKFKSNILLAVSRLEVIKRGQYLSPSHSNYIRRGGLSVN